jgi:hypothetical protein
MRGALKQFLLLVILLAASCLSTTAQNSNKSENQESKLVIKWSPLHLIAKYPTLQLALEQRISKNISFQYEAGTVLSINGLNVIADEDHSRYRGFKAKFEVKRYFNADDYRRFYCAAELFYNRINYNTNEFFIVHPDLGDASKDYNQKIKYSKQYREGGLVIKGGVVFNVYRFRIDLHAGASISNYKERSIGEPALPNYSRPEDYEETSIIRLFNLSDTNSIYIFPRLGFRIGYVIK